MKNKIMVFLTLLLVVLFYAKPAAAQFVFPTMAPFPTFAPCFPFCNNSWIRPTTAPTATPTPTKTPTPTQAPTTAPTSGPTSTPIPSQPASIYFGAYVGDGFSNLTNVTNFETVASKKLSIVMWYQAWGVSDDTKNFQTAWVNNVRNHGSIPMITWEPWNYTAGVNQPTYSLQNIINGNFDAYITKWAVDSKNWGKPYFLRFAHEMNGTWYPWSEGVNGNTTGKYAQAWKHIHDIFEAQGVKNVTWVWSPNVVYPGSVALSGLYPGDEYVDWVAMDGYNWGNINGGWQTFTQLFGPTYNQISGITEKPMMIGETASAEVGGSKATWITNALGSEIDSMPRIKALIWFNANKEKDWRINSTTTARNAFRTAISNTKYAANQYATITSCPVEAL